MKITITVEEENLNYIAKGETATFEIAGIILGNLERNYERRVAMELDKADVMAEANSEETI